MVETKRMDRILEKEEGRRLLSSRDEGTTTSVSSKQWKEPGSGRRAGGMLSALSTVQAQANVPFHLSVLTITVILVKRVINLIRDVCNDKHYQMLQHPLP